MTSPAICVCSDADDPTIANCQFYFFSKKIIEPTPQLHPSQPLDWRCNPERFYLHARWAKGILTSNLVGHVYLEGYAYSSRAGMTFDIGESTGALKMMLWENGIGCTTVSPTQSKKLATGKGNANKELIMEAFAKVQPWKDLKGILHETEKQNNPSSDIADSYFIMQTGLSMRFKH
jgi:Holliday junction resolvasome RuvABC endonuclease subunit